MGSSPKPATRMALTDEQVQQENSRRKKVFHDYLVSKEYQDKLIQRLQLNDAAEHNVEARTYLWHLCARPDNPVEGAKFFINTFGWTLDPRPEHDFNGTAHLPFITFEYQDRAIEWFIDHVDGGRDGLVEKSRDMGMSWLFFVWMPIWFWLFRDGTNILIGSYKEALVDDRTPDSLFGKIDYALSTLPKWLIPHRFNPDKHRTKLRLSNPVNGNVITGDTMNPNFGRGSRKTAVLFDELGFWDYAEDAWSSCGDSTSCRIANSTPNGDNFFHSLIEDGIERITLPWHEHPLKDQGWYDFEVARRTPEEVAQEIDLSYQKSKEGTVYPEWNNDLFVSYGHYPYVPGRQVYVGWDFGKTDDTAIIWCQKDHDDRLRIIDTYRNSGKNIDFYVPFVTGIINSDNEAKYRYSQEELELIREHREWGRGTHFGDPAGRFRNQVSDETVFTVLKGHGIIVNFKESWKEFKVRQSATKRLIMSGINLNENKRTKQFKKYIANASFPRVLIEGRKFIKSDAPKHDGTSHYRSALEYLALGLEGDGARTSKPRDKVKVRPRNPRRVLGY